MQPASIPLSIVQGATLRETIRVMQSQFEYRPITAISSTAPVLLTAAHDLPMDWPVWVQGVQGYSELNKASNQAPHFATYVDATTLELNAINGAGRSGSGGMLVYHPPVDLTGTTAELQVLDDKGNVLLEFAPTVHAGGWIDIELSDEETQALTWRKAVWRLNLIRANGDVEALFAGPATVSPPGTAPMGCLNSSQWVFTFGTQGPAGSGGGGGGGGLTSFNGRTAPAVVLIGTDVTSALGYSPVNPTALASVAFSARFDDLIDKPFIPASYGDIGAASAEQGAKADAAVPSSALGVSVATLVAGVVPSSQLPSFVDDVIEAANYASLPATGEGGKIYVTDVPYTAGGITSSQFRWGGSAYAPIIASPGSTDAVSEGSVNKYFSAALVRLVTLGALTLTNAAIVAGESYEVLFGKLQAQINAIKTSITDGLLLKVDKVAGYALSKNDFTDVLKAKLDLCQVGVPVADVSADYTFVLADANTSKRHPPADATARAWAIPSNAAVPYPIGTALVIDNDFGAGIITLSITTDTMVLVGTAGTTGTRTLASGGQLTAVKVAANRWRVSGVGLT